MAVLMALAGALGVTEAYLLNPAEVSLRGVEFRTHRLKVREAAEVEARILAVVDRYLQVERILGFEYDDGLGGTERPMVQTLDDVEHAAATLRAHWKLGDDPIPDPGDSSASAFGRWPRTSSPRRRRPSCWE